MRLIYKDEVYGIIGACFDVYKELSSGLSEPIYQEALELEFKSRGIPYEREKELVVYYGSVLISSGEVCEKVSIFVL